MLTKIDVSCAMRVTLLALILVASNVFAGDFEAKLPNGNKLLVLDQSKECRGNRSAALLDANNLDLNHTCSVAITSSGATVTFKNSTPIFVPVSSFRILATPPTVN